LGLISLWTISYLCKNETPAVVFASIFNLFYKFLYQASPENKKCSRSYSISSIIIQHCNLFVLNSVSAIPYMFTNEGCLLFAIKDISESMVLNSEYDNSISFIATYIPDH